MPSLEWIGKEKVVNYHLQVPYKILNRKYSFDKDGQHTEDNGSENMIIHGDNLLALKSLLPKYEGKVDCIYIDPPYNTGNENWVYNDNVNDPQIKKWLGEVVGKEGEDLSRHDKWLCMMYPRLKLLYRLLSDDGVIFISIDDREQVLLRMICNEIFNENNFIAQFVWQKRTSPDMRKLVSTAHEYICAYSKNIENINKSIHKLSLSPQDEKKYKNPDNDPKGPWASSDFTAQGYRPNQMYEITTPTGIKYVPPKGKCWKNIESEFLKQRDEGRIWFGIDGNSFPRRKTYLTERTGKNVWTWWDKDSVGHTQEATQEIAKIYGAAAIFDYPKPVRLVQRIIQIATNKDSIILDSFAGSATTAHAVLNMNKKDGGHRKFILVEMMDYADTITAERVKRVITGYKKDEEILLYNQEITEKNLAEGEAFIEEAKSIAKEAKESGTYSSVKKPKINDGHLQVVGIIKAKDQEPGIPGDFSYYELGDLLFDGELLNTAVGEDEIRKYVYYSETKQPLETKSDELFYMGTYLDTAYYFFYKEKEITTLNREFLHTVKTKAESYVIYADLCALSDSELEQWHITFKKIPRDIHRI